MEVYRLFVFSRKNLLTQNPVSRTIINLINPKLILLCGSFGIKYMVSLRLKLIVAALSFFLIWGFLLAPRVYSLLDNSEAIPQPIAFLIVFAIYFGTFTFIFLGLVEGNLEFFRGSLTLGVLTALGMLNIDLGESTIPISPQGDLITTSLGWRSDLSTLYWGFWHFLGVPKEWMWFLVMFISPAIVFSLIIFSFTTKQVREYWSALKP